ncbi:MAG: helix-turn-helix domain-containing protein [Candidatus Eremiobacteraeota bacterium]|nr:helix-turn-helix domain-containing protein [Candidatus Eremiobacteraeota bacterium]
MKTVRKWRSRFKYWGLQGLRDEERSGRPRVFDFKVRHEVFSLVVQTPPRALQPVEPGLARQSPDRLQARINDF